MSECFNIDTTLYEVVNTVVQRYIFFQQLETIFPIAVPQCISECIGGHSLSIRNNVISFVERIDVAICTFQAQTIYYCRCEIQKKKKTIRIQTMSLYGKESDIHKTVYREQLNSYYRPPECISSNEFDEHFSKSNAIILRWMKEKNFFSHLVTHHQYQFFITFICGRHTQFVIFLSSNRAPSSNFH